MNLVRMLGGSQPDIGKTVLITGRSSGIERMSADLFGENRWPLRQPRNPDAESSKTTQSSAFFILRKEYSLYSLPWVTHYENLAANFCSSESWSGSRSCNRFPIAL